MARDQFHNVVRNALEKDGWKITADPYEINIDDVDFEIDLAAEQILAAERENKKIAVEVKSFLSPSFNNLLLLATDLFGILLTNPSN
jgi:hypothetical protein